MFYASKRFIISFVKKAQLGIQNSEGIKPCRIKELERNKAEETSCLSGPVTLPSVQSKPFWLFKSTFIKYYHISEETFLGTNQMANDYFRLCLFIQSLNFTLDQACQHPYQECKYNLDI